VSTATAEEQAFVHPALFYAGEAEYVAGTAGFVRDGLAAREPVAVAVPPANLALLRTALGRDAERVQLLDMTEVGRNPGRIIPGVLRAFADRHRTGRVRIVGEPIWPSRSATEYPACVQHEALINMAFAGRAVTILCPYDVGGLGPGVLDDAVATHPVLIDAAGQRPSDGYAPERVVAAYNQPLPEPRTAVSVSFDRTSFTVVRRLATEFAERAGLPAGRVGDLAVAVNELATNSVRHGGGAGRLRLWTDHRDVICEVSDAGQLTDPLAGRHPVAPDSLNGRGLLLVNLLADLVRTYTGPGGTTVRLHIAR
jgi:anti-sigma regulatory factor (Ser/Thr protein kinase)